MMFDQPPRDRESQTSAFANSLGSGAGLAETFEDGLLVLRLDADSSVANYQAQGCIRYRGFNPTRPPAGVNLMALLNRL